MGKEKIGADGDDEVEEWSESENDSHSCEGVHFDDSEEERVQGFGEDVEEGQSVTTLEVSVTPEVEGPMPSLNNEQNEGFLVTPEVAAMHKMDDEYATDELDSASEEDSENENPKPKYAKCNPEVKMTANDKFSGGMEFSSLQQFKEAVLHHNVLIGREVRFPRNDLRRAKAVCINKKTCPYFVYASRVGRTTTYRVKNCSPTHSCVRSFNNKNANSKWVAKELVDKIKNNEKMKLGEVVGEIRDRYSVVITGHRAWKAREVARKVVEGDAVKQYSLLWSYSEELRKRGPGNTCKLELDRPGPGLQPRFGRYYLCFAGCKKAIKSSCRPFIGLDGCHLKNKYGGQLLIAVGRDPNEQYLPLAFAVVETESKDTWSWFMKLLMEDIGDQRWCFISDQQKGLVAVFEEQYPGVEHRFCLRHLYANFKKKFGGGTQMRDIMMAAAKATYFEAWEAKMNEMKVVNSNAYEWLLKIPTKCWCKHAFPFYSRCDVLMNNLSESFNATILLQRDKPIITMFEWIRTYLMGRFASLRESARKYTGTITPKPLKRLNWEIEKSGSWCAEVTELLRFQVFHTYFTEKFIVDLNKYSCTCNFWELVGIPCRHAVAAIRRKEDDPQKYVHRYYSIEKYRECYSEGITPISGENMWPKTYFPDILPPAYKRGPGRPKKLRRRQPDETTSQNRWNRNNTTNQCTVCQDYGHNARGCKIAKEQAAKAANDTQRHGSQPTAPKKRGKDKGSLTSDVPLPTQGSQTTAPNKRGRSKGQTSKTDKTSEPPQKKTKTKKGKQVEGAEPTIDELIVADPTVKEPTSVVPTVDEGGTQLKRV